MKDKKCYIDLHLHLDGSLSLNSIKRLCEMQNIELKQEDIDILFGEKNFNDLNDYLKRFDFPITLLQTKEAITFSVKNLLEELSKQGVIYTEIRFAPQFHKQKGLTQSEVVEAAIDGLKDSPIPANLILCCMRSDSNHDENVETIEVAKKYLGKGVCALDLAGAEGLFKTETFEDIFALARKYNIPFTIHAGEADGPESVKKALSFGAKRIGHGVRSYEDENLFEELRHNGVTLEFCPTSNLDTKMFKDYNSYPLKKYFDAGINVTLNTDNLTVSSTDIAFEFDKMIEANNLTDADVKKLLQNSVNAAFISEKEKQNLLKIVENTFDEKENTL